MAPDRNEMARLHEEFLAALNGGRKSKASGSTWKDQGDGRGNSLTEEFAFAWDGKSTRGQSIAVSREMITKIREQAAGERPQIGLRFYGSDDLRQVDEDWIAITAADYAELLADARYRPDSVVVPAPAEQDLTGPGGWLPDPPFVREREGRWQDPLATPDYTHTDPGPQVVILPQDGVPGPVPPPLHGVYPADLPPPPHQLWPCLVVDSRTLPGEPARRENKGYQVAIDGRITEFSVSSVRYDTGLGHTTLYVNEGIVRSGQLYVDGALRVMVGNGLNRLTAQ